VRAQIDSNNEHCSSGAAHDLCLREGVSLIIRSAQRPFSRAGRNIELSQSGIQPVVFELLLTPGRGKEASLVRDRFEVDFESLIQRGLFEFHSASFILEQRAQKLSADSKSSGALWGMLPHFRLSSESIL